MRRLRRELSRTLVCSSKTQRLNSHLGGSAFEKVPTTNFVEANITGEIRVGFVGFPSKNLHFISVEKLTSYGYIA